jgi:hypothetical protein
LSENLKQFTDEQRQRVKITEEEISYQYIGLFKDYELNGRRYVEVSVIAHVLQDIQSPPNSPISFATKAPKLIANYRYVPARN